ncbi:AcrVA2 family anti-CRISPR protein [Acinetobacter sp.]|uniref:AcrVA2 family anti-CRISPR protein n=1 Tax=Acinetobacter sp. TaxID=472 RepID=UPI003D083B5D
MSQIKEPVPLKLLKNFSKKYKHIFDAIDTVRAKKGKEPGFDWNDACYIPIGTIMNLMYEKYSNEMVLNASVLAALAAWQKTKGIYRFDETLIEEMLDMDSSDMKIPTEVLLRLPQWCLYIETPFYKINGVQMDGFFVHIEHDVNKGDVELRFIRATNNHLYPLVMHIGDWTIEEGVQRAFAKAKENALTHTNMDVFQVLKDLGEVIDDEIKMTKQLVSLVLYLCSDSADYTRDKPIMPAPIKTKMGLHLPSAEKAKIWDVGVRTGSIIRLSRQQSGSGETYAETGRSVRPHVRKAHWHGYWTGPRAEDKKQDRKYSVKWIPPVFVKADTGELPAVIRKIKK